MRSSSLFSLIVFAPVLIAFLLPSVFLVPSGLLVSLLALLDPTISLSEAASYNLWAFGPTWVALALFFTGRGLHSLHKRQRSPYTVWLVTWIIISLMLFLAIWLWVTLITSIGASDMPEQVFLGFTAKVAAGLTLLAQALVIPWLVAVSRKLAYP
jgi:hypothetical protein